jgi:hypothetical protein
MKTKLLLATTAVVCCAASAALAEETFGFEMQISGVTGHGLKLVLYENSNVIANADFTSGPSVLMNVPYSLARRVTQFCVVSDVTIAHFSDGSGKRYEASCDAFDGRALPSDPQSGYRLTYTATLNQS